MSQNNQPIIIEKSAKDLKYLYPEDNNGPKIVINSGQTINVFCPGKTNMQSSRVLEPSWLEVNGKKFQESKIGVPLECIGKDKFDAKGKTVTFSEISCEQTPRASYNPVLRKTDTKCGTGYRYEIGFIMADHSFLKTIDLCHDTQTANTLWSHSVIESVNHVAVRYTGEKAKTFKTGILYENMAMSKESPYSLDSVYKNLITTFNSEKVASQYASPKTSTFVLQY